MHTFRMIALVAGLCGIAVAGGVLAAPADDIKALLVGGPCVAFFEQRRSFLLSYQDPKAAATRK